MKLTILAVQNTNSENLEIGVQVLVNHFFVLDYSSITIGIFGKALPHLRCVVDGLT